MTCTKELNAARKLIFIDEKLQEATQSLSTLKKQVNLASYETFALLELQAIIAFKQKKYLEAARLFKESGNLYHEGYSYLMANKSDEAANCWNKLLTTYPHHWCMSLYGMLARNLQTMPTFLQIRNHLELDVFELHRAGHHLWLQNLLQYGEYLSQINLETWKYLGRAFLNAGINDAQAEIYLMQGQKILPNDPEVYFHLGELRIKQKRWEEAQMVLRQGIQINKTYTPAITLLNEVEKHL